MFVAGIQLIAMPVQQMTPGKVKLEFPQQHILPASVATISSPMVGHSLLLYNLIPINIFYLSEYFPCLMASVRRHHASFIGPAGWASEPSEILTTIACGCVGALSLVAVHSYKLHFHNSPSRLTNVSLISNCNSARGSTGTIMLVEKSMNVQHISR